MSEQKLKPIDKSKKSNRRCCNCEYYPNKADYFVPNPCEKKSRLVNYWNCCESFTWSSKKTYKEESDKDLKSCHGALLQR